MRRQEEQLFPKATIARGEAESCKPGNIIMLYLNGVYITGQRDVFFRRVEPPTFAEMERLIHRISHRVGRYLERAGLLVRDMENSYLPAMNSLTESGTGQL